MLVVLFAMPSRVVVRFALYLSAEIERFKDIIGGRGLVYLNNNSNDNYNRMGRVVGHHHVCYSKERYLQEMDR